MKFIPIALTLLAAGCAAAVTEPSDPAETVVAVGQTGTVPPVSVQLDRIEADSRCPRDVVCIWAGSVTARIVVRVGALTTPVTLTTTSLNSPIDSTRAIVGGYTIRIADVKPERLSRDSIRAADYRLTFRIVPTP